MGREGDREEDKKIEGKGMERGRADGEGGRKKNRRWRKKRELLKRVKD